MGLKSKARIVATPGSSCVATPRPGMGITTDRRGVQVLDLETGFSRS